MQLYPIFLWDFFCVAAPAILALDIVAGGLCVYQLPGKFSRVHSWTLHDAFQVFFDLLIILVEEYILALEEPQPFLLGIELNL